MKGFIEEKLSNNFLKQAKGSNYTRRSGKLDTKNI